MLLPGRTLYAGTHRNTIELSRYKRTAHTFFSSKQKAEIWERQSPHLRAARLPSLRINQGHLTRVSKEHGLGTAKTAQLKSALEIGRRLCLTQLDEKYQIKSPADAANLVIVEFTYLDREERPICTR